jgi:hypothetical protein
MKTLPAILTSAAIALAPVGLPALADAPLGPEAFERRVEGRTLTFGVAGEEPYGIERYLPGRRVVWAFLGDSCLEGRWYGEDDRICFVYEDGTGPECWRFFEAESGPDGSLTARFVSDPENDVTYEIREATIPLLCPGAGV